MNSFNERVKLLVELLEEGHITEEEFAELVGSIRGGAVNEAYDIERNKDVNIAGHAICLDEEEYLKQVNDPNKLDVYESFINAKPGDITPLKHNTLEDFVHPLRNTFYHIVDKHEVEEAVDNYNRMNGPEAYHRINGLEKSAMGLYKQDVHSGNTIRGCRVVVDTGGKLKCIEPFHSHEHNHSWSFS